MRSSGFIALLTVIAAFVTGIAEAQVTAPAVPDQPVLITADELSQDEELGTITARGNVEITQGERLLLANTVSYNQKSDTVSASGNVTLMEPGGEVIFAEFVELTDKLKNGIVRQLRILLTDESRFAASEAERRDGNLTVMKRAVYSPCEACEKDPERPLVWQLKAETVEHDQERQEIRYRNAFLEMFGVPVVYVPYFSHPDPTVTRKSGFLAPDFGTGGNLGGFIRLPYYVVLDKDKDATVTPIYTKDEGLVMSGEYRQRFNNGEIKLAGSITEADRTKTQDGVQVVRRDRIRGHVAIDGRYDFNETWRAGANIERASDRSYLQRFNFFEQGGDMLESNAYVEGFRPRTYAAANIYAFQDLRSGDRPEQPFIAPLVQYNHVSEADRYGGRYSVDTDFRVLTRSDGPTTQRFSLRPGYEISHVTDFGLLATFRGSLRADLYNVNQTSDARVNEGVDDSVTGRFLPRATLDVRYPLVRSTGSIRQIIEPIAMFTASPTGQNPSEIPNEDSTAFEADDTNLFSEDRLAGGDRVESGQRFAYGVRVAAYGARDGKASAFIGQSYRVNTDEKLSTNSLLDRDKSDIVGRVDIRPNQYIDVLYRFAFSADDFAEPKRNDVTFTLGPPAYQLSGSYSFITATSEFEEREEIKLSIKTKITDNWSFQASTHRDIDAGEYLQHRGQLTYEDECIAFDIIGTRSFFEDEDIDPSDSILFQLRFKHLGEVKTTAG